MNLKHAAKHFGRSQTWMRTEARRAKIKPILGQYIFTDKELDKIGKYQRGWIMKAHKETGVSQNRVNIIVRYCKLSPATDWDKLIRGCNLWKTKYYTLKGIKAILDGKIEVK